MEEKITYEIDIEFVLCCDLCNEVYNNVFDCPICERESDTGFYDNMYGMTDIEITCTHCNSTFRLLGEFCYYPEDERWEKVN